MKKTAVYKWMKRFSEGWKSYHWWREITMVNNEKKTLQKFVKLCMKIVGWEH